MGQLLNNSDKKLREYIPVSKFMVLSSKVINIKNPGYTK